MWFWLRKWFRTWVKCWAWIACSIFIPSLFKPFIFLIFQYLIYLSKINIKISIQINTNINQIFTHIYTITVLAIGIFSFLYKFTIFHPIFFNHIKTINIKNRHKIISVLFLSFISIRYPYFFRCETCLYAFHFCSQWKYKNIQLGKFSVLDKHFMIIYTF